MKRKILKAVGYIMLAIGIIGGLSTIEMIFNGNLAIWIILVVCFCGIGIISLSASNGVNNIESEALNTERDSSNSPKIVDNHILHYGKRLYYSIKEQVVIAVLLLIIAIELNDKLSEIAFEIYRK